MKADIRKILSLMVVLFAVCLTVHAKPRVASCRLFYLTVGDGGGGRSSYTNDLGRFQLNGEEGETIRSFNFEDFVITTGVDYVYEYSKRNSVPYAIDLAISVFNKAEEKIFEKPNTSEASTRDLKKWNLSVTKNIYWKNTTYMFTLSCSEGSSLPRRK